MEAELTQLRAQLEEAERRRQEAERTREEEQRRRVEEQRKREEAERAAASAVKQNLVEFLEGCHCLSTRIKVVTEVSAATGGSTTNPTYRLFPQRILPWQQFATFQHEFWDLLPKGSPLWSDRAYPSAADLDFVGKQIDPIGSENELRLFQRLTLERRVQEVLERINNDSDLGERLLSNGKVSFENQESFRGEEVTVLGQAMEGLSVDIASDKRPRNTRADQFCVVRSRNGIARPVVAIEYKAPHKLTIDEIWTGLRDEIWPERDVIDRTDDTYEFLCKNLMAAVITQLFSYMIDKGVRYGYVCTGEAFIFMCIPDDPTEVYYSVNVPNRDYTEDQANRLERTAVSQVLAFIYQALQDEQPDQAWMQAARSRLRRWKVEFIDELQKIPITQRKSRDASSYQPSEWAPSTRRSPIALRRRCRPADAATPTEGSDRDSEDGDMPSPTPNVQTRSKAAAAAAQRARPSAQSGPGSGRGQPPHAASSRSIPAIERQPYCTHQCLRGLSTGSPIDESCPNAAAHGGKHISHAAFIQLLLQQLTIDKGSNADCCAIGVHGSRGALLKICLTSYGYTFVAKGVKAENLEHLENETQIYNRLDCLQGEYVPVCCGRIDINPPFYYEGAKLRHLLLMSWAGQSLVALAREETTSSTFVKHCLELANRALAVIHQQQVFHGDVMPRNMLYDKEAKKLMIVDFERSKLRDDERKVLGELSPNRNRKVESSPNKTDPDCFAKEMGGVV